MKPDEIVETLGKIRNAKSIKELDNQEFRDQMKRLADTTVEYCDKKIPEPDASEIPLAFLRGEPDKVLAKLVEFRSGRLVPVEKPESPSEGAAHSPQPASSKASTPSSNTRPSTSSRPSSAATAAKASISLEDAPSHAHFVWVYRHFVDAFINAMNRREDVKGFYITKGCTRLTLLELNSPELMVHKNKAPEESLTAYVISTHLGVLFTVAHRAPLRAKLGEELRKYGYFTILASYTKATYASILVSIYTSESIFYDFLDLISSFKLVPG